MFEGQELPFSEAVEVGGTVYLSGQIGVEPGTLSLVEGGMEAEARQTMGSFAGGGEELRFGPPPALAVQEPAPVGTQVSDTLATTRVETRRGISRRPLRAAASFPRLRHAHPIWPCEQGLPAGSKPEA